MIQATSMYQNKHVYSRVCVESNPHPFTQKHYENKIGSMIGIEQTHGLLRHGNQGLLWILVDKPSPMRQQTSLIQKCSSIHRQGNGLILHYSLHNKALFGQQI